MKRWLLPIAGLLFASCVGLLARELLTAYREKWTYMQCLAIPRRIAESLTDGKSQLDIDAALDGVGWGRKGLLARNKEGDLVDAWGNVFRVTTAREGDKLRITTTSGGADGRIGTWDDIASSYTVTADLARPTNEGGD